MGAGPMMGGRARARPLAFEGLPRLSRAQVARGWRLCRALAALPPARTLRLGRLGPIALWPARLTFGAEAGAAGEAFGVAAAGQVGRLVVPPALALAVVAAVLEAPPLALRPLGRAERGVLAGVIAAALASLGLEGATVALEAPPDDPEDALGLELAVQVAGTAGRVRLALPPAWLDRPPGAPVRIDPTALWPRLDLELARTHLPAAAWATAAPGDALVFEGSSPVHDDQPWPVVLRTGGFRGPAELGPDGTLRWRGPPAPGEEPVSDDARTVPDLPGGGEAPSPEAARALAGAAIEVVAELGRVVVRGDELAGLLEGAVLPLGVPRPARVDLRVGDRSWASGELVTVDGELAVRITSLRR